MERDRCRDLRDAYPAYVTGSLSAALELRIQRHLGDGCAPCAAELSALYEAFHAVPLSFPPQPLGDGSAELLVRNIAAQAQEQPEPPIVYPETRERQLLWVLVVLFAVALAAAAVWGRSSDGELDDAARRVWTAEQQTRRAVDDYRTLRERSERVEAKLRALTDPEVSSHDFPPGPDGLRARAFVDLPDGRLLLAVSGLPELRPGQGHALWWNDTPPDEPAAWSPLGLLPETPTDGGALAFELPEGASLPARLRISREEVTNGSPPAPIGPIVLEGQLVEGRPYASGAAAPQGGP